MFIRADPFKSLETLVKVQANHCLGVSGPGYSSNHWNSLWCINYTFIYNRHQIPKILMLLFSCFAGYRGESNHVLCYAGTWYRKARNLRHHRYLKLQLIQNLILNDMIWKNCTLVGMGTWVSVNCGVLCGLHGWNTTYFGLIFKILSFCENINMTQNKYCHLKWLKHQGYA